MVATTFVVVAYAVVFSDPNRSVSAQARQRRRFHLPHDLPAVSLQRHLAEVELGRDLLVRPPRDDDERHDLALALCQRDLSLRRFDGHQWLRGPVPCPARSPCESHLAEPARGTGSVRNSTAPAFIARTLIGIS